MLVSEIIVISIALLVFGLLFVLAGLRLRSQEAVIYHLVLYEGLGFFLGLSLLATVVPLATLGGGGAYELAAEAALLAMVLVFGTLAFNLTRKGPSYIGTYWVVILAIIALWGVTAFNLQGWGDIILNSSGIGQLGPPNLILSGLGWVIAIVTSTLVVGLDYRQKHPLQHKNRLRYWLISTILLAISGGIYFFSPAFFNTAGMALLAGGSILASYTVLSYQTPDLKLLVGRAIRYFGATTALAAVSLFSLAVIVFINRTYPSVSLLFWSIILAVLVAIVFPPFWRLTNRLLTRIVFGKQHPDEKQVIKHYSQSLSSALDMKRLGDTVINLMIETLGIEKGIVFVNERSSTGEVILRPVSSIGSGDLTSGHLDIDSPFVDYFRRGKRSLSQYDIDVLPEFRLISKEERQWLSNLGMELYIAVLRQREMVGVLAFGPQPQGTAYYDEDLDLMVALADQTALAMDSARLFEQLSIVNEEVGTLTEQLAGVDETKSDFLSIASHELRTPLTQIHGYSQMLLELKEEELKDPTHIKALIEGVVKGSERMKGVVDLMFDVTEAQIGDMRLFKGSVNVEDVIDQATSPFLTALDERRIAFGKAGIKDLPIIEADGTRLVQAFENLIGNAIKYTPDGGTITVEGQTCTLDNAEPAIEIIVVDSGIGIDPEHHDKIFEKFFRVDDTMHHSTGQTKFKGAGPGLGLALVKGIAQAHHGKVWVESVGHDEENCPGSKFHFVIPATQSADEEISTQKQSQIETRHWRRSDLMEEETP